MRFILTGVVFLVVISAHAQYWFGPKVGFQRTDFIYHNNKEYGSDTFNVQPNYNFHAGAVVIYQATDKYAVHGELLYERVSKTVKEKLNPEIPIFSKTVYNYLSIPFSMRLNFGRRPFHYYVGAGPKVSFLMGGSGFLDLDEFDEARGVPKDYKFVFDQDKSNGTTLLAIPEVNRFQYALAISAGMYFDLVNRDRISIDARYSFGHSNMGFNENPDLNNFVSYSENFRFRQNTFSVSITYLIEYDVKLQRKGMSTIKESNIRRPKRR